MIKPSASVIVPTYNGQKKITGLLQSLEKQSYKNFEVIIVIDGSKDDTRKEIESKTWNLLSLIIIEQVNKGRAAARNTGARIAKAGQFIFFDDDMIVDSYCIEKYSAFYLDNSHVITMGSIVEPSKAGDPEIKKYKHFLNNSWEKDLEPYYQKIIPQKLVVLAAANCSIPKDIFDDLNGFDENLKDIEDYDFALRLREKDIKTFYLNNAIAIHNDHFSFRKYAERCKEYFSNKCLAALMKPDLYQNDSSLTSSHTTIYKIIYSIFKYAFWLNIADRTNFFKILPVKVRYKFYGVIIAAYSQNK